MTSIEDLRDTLDQHSSDLEHLTDGAAATRVAQVHGRVRVVRRRRRVAAAGGVAAVLAVVGGVALLTNSSDRAIAPATVVGVSAPGTMEALGFSYDLVDTVDGEDGKVSVELEASDEPRLVSWATSGADGEVVVRSDEADGPVVHTTDDFGDYVYVPADSDTEVTVRAAQGDPGVAVYALGEGRPEGYTKGGVTFRQSTATGELAGAAMGDPGQVDVSFDAQAPVGSVGVSYAAFCLNGPDEVFLELEVGGEPATTRSASCSDVVDPNGAARLDTRFRIKPGEDLSTRLHVTQPDGTPLPQDDDIVLGVAAYTTETYVTAIESDDSRRQVIESGGHRWEKVEIDYLDPASADGGAVTSTAPDASGPLLAIVQTDVKGTTDVEFGSGAFVGSDRGEGTATNTVTSGEVLSVRRRNGQFEQGDEIVVTYYAHADPQGTRGAEG
ncbi:hypothetical protein BH09ACT12_BH09ACT12_19000 [soil metagenome]